MVVDDEYIIFYKTLNIHLILTDDVCFVHNDLLSVKKKFEVKFKTHK